MVGFSGIATRALACTAILAAAPATALAAPRTFASATLPSRAAGKSALAPAAARVARDLSRAAGGTAPRTPTPPATAVADTLATLARGRTLFATGALDQAADLLDEGLAAAARIPHRFAGSQAIVSAHVVRATIALARGEKATAAALFERILRWDPTFSLTASERSPRLAQAVAAARARLGHHPGLRAADLGRACALADTVVIARPAPKAQVELIRVDGCRVTAAVTVAAKGIATAAVALGADPTPAAPTDSRPASIWHNPWLWAAVGAVAAGSTAVVLWKLQPGSEADVVLHF
ncbi:MAG TPA: hypothetical protein VFG83_13650 [Kofleriaceae bacterium]|nr:hypothetical protein [Kofleriaceae bacterium]